MLTWKTVNPPVGPTYKVAYSGHTRMLAVIRSVISKHFIIRTSLPSFSETIEYESEKDAMIIAEELFSVWLQKSNLHYKEE